MRRIIALIVFICLLLTACGKNEKPKKENISSKTPSSSDTESYVENEDEDTDETEEEDSMFEDEEDSDDWEFDDDFSEEFDEESPALSGTVNVTYSDSDDEYSEENKSDSPKLSGTVNIKTSDSDKENSNDFTEDDESETPILSGTVNNNTPNSEEYEKPKSVFVDTQSGGYDAEAKKLRNAIINSKNAYKIEGTTYYISPTGDDFNSGTSPDDAWQTLDALMINSYLFKEGDAVLFERGGVYRANSSIIIATNNMTFGAYGEGPKPCIYGSHMNYADELIWESSNKKNIWKMEFPLRDAGVMVFNNGEFGGVKKAGLAAMTQNGHFYHNTSDKMLYVYCDKGNPGKAWENIEIGTEQFIISVYGNRHDIKIDNICFKYTGAHAVDFFENNYNISVTNCEFGWIGGSIQSGVTRYGNAIQFWDSCWNVEIKNNWIYQVYDAGITFQYSIFTDIEGGKYHDIEFSNNLMFAR